MLELIVAFFLGIIIGCVIGMIPGIHVNTAGAIIFASSTFLLSIFSPEFLCVVILHLNTLNLVFLIILFALHLNHLYILLLLKSAF